MIPLSGTHWTNKNNNNNRKKNLAIYHLLSFCQSVFVSFSPSAFSLSVILFVFSETLVSASLDKLCRKFTNCIFLFMKWSSLSLLKYENQHLLCALVSFCQSVFLPICPSVHLPFSLSVILSFFSVLLSFCPSAL
jgi:hypothetical protein